MNKNVRLLLCPGIDFTLNRPACYHITYTAESHLGILSLKKPICESLKFDVESGEITNYQPLPRIPTHGLLLDLIGDCLVAISEQYKSDDICERIGNILVEQLLKVESRVYKTADSENSTALRDAYPSSFERCVATSYSLSIIGITLIRIYDLHNDFRISRELKNRLAKNLKAMRKDIDDFGNFKR